MVLATSRVLVNSRVQSDLFFHSYGKSLNGIWRFLTIYYFIEFESKLARFIGNINLPFGHTYSQSRKNCLQSPKAGEQGVAETAG